MVGGWEVGMDKVSCGIRAARGTRLGTESRENFPVRPSATTIRRATADSTEKRPLVVVTLAVLSKFR